MNPPNDLFLQAAWRIGARLGRDAVWAGNRCNWLGDSIEFTGATWSVVHRSFGPLLYDGTSGIALFLARLYQLTGESIFRTTAEGAIHNALAHLDDIPVEMHSGLYSGQLGIAYVLITLGGLFDRSNLLDRGTRILDSLCAEDPEQQGLDVIAGSAGAIPLLLQMHRRFQNDALLQLAIRHGEHLLNTANKQDDAWSWNTLNMPDTRDLTGFGHGAAGIGLALLELGTCTGDARFTNAAEQAFRYETRCFSPEQQNWPDFRNFMVPTPGANTGPNFMVAWCHGAAGIGLSRLRAYQLSKNETRRGEAEMAIRTTLGTLNPALVQSGNFSLCHGNAGNAELLLYASQVLDNQAYRSAADQIGVAGIEVFQKNDLPWPCGIMGGGETPNLMLGTAGIGYFYLRLHDPLRIPSILITIPQNQAA